MVIVISKKYPSIGLISEKYKAKRNGENIVSPHPLASWNAIKYKTKWGKHCFLILTTTMNYNSHTQCCWFFFLCIWPFFFFGYWFFFNLVIVCCVYKDLELIIFFNFFYMVIIIAIGYHYRDIKKMSQHRDIKKMSQHRVNIRKIS